MKTLTITFWVEEDTISSKQSVDKDFNIHDMRMVLSEFEMIRTQLNLTLNNLINQKIIKKSSN